MSFEEMLLRRLAEADGLICGADLSNTEQAAAERLLDMGYVSYDVAIALTARGVAMAESLDVN